ncbi:MAG: hypothetical protein F6J86_03350 [Symploca sp. SIO1B1]|nr:hypothetical protein [Symploca sp. SIO2D2]NER92884.1 hypothetical protein [Symploca sp. SIO1B1]
MVSFVRNDISPSRNIPEVLSAVVSVIGDRLSGKTAYIATLARWPGDDSSTSPVQQVKPINDDTEELITDAENILEQGEMFAGTDFYLRAYEIPSYSLNIVLKDLFSKQQPWIGVSSPVIELNIICKEYSGDFFKRVLHQANEPLFQDYLEDCVKASGIMLLVDGLANHKDREYANILNKFLIELERVEAGMRKRRIALVITKCDQPELWVNRHQPRQITRIRFPQVMKKLQAWEQSGAGNFNCFATSVLGMLGEQYPEPNVRYVMDNSGHGTRPSVLKNPQRWKPFGLIAPLYWLCTGERHMKLEQD